MGHARAKRILENVDPETPFYARVTFIEGLAAIAGTSRKKSPEKSLGRTRKLPRFFGLQRRRRGWSGCSTTSESGMPWRRYKELYCRAARLRTCRNQCMDQVQQNAAPEHLATQTGHHAVRKLLAHHTAACFPTLQHCSESVLLARCLSSDVWDDGTWASWCRGIQKAPVPLHRARRRSRWGRRSPPNRSGIASRPLESQPCAPWNGNVPFGRAE